jgi:hypothetical protein
MAIRRFFPLLLCFAVGCSSVSKMPGYRQDASPTVQGDYRVMRYNAVGQSEGFKLLGTIPFANANYSDAMTRLWNTSGVCPGTATALTNVTEEHEENYYVLFSIPKRKIRADVIEYNPVCSPEPRLLNRATVEGPPGPSRTTELQLPCLSVTE